LRHVGQPHDDIRVGSGWQRIGDDRDIEMLSRMRCVVDHHGEIWHLQRPDDRVGEQPRTHRDENATLP